VSREEELGELLNERDFLVLEKRRNHRPWAMTEIIAQEVAHSAKEYREFRESPYFIRFLINIDRLGHHITEIQRLTKSPVPPIFYTHALRFLTLWLFTLPFALVDKLPMRALVPTMGLMTWILFGLRELGIKAQYPFSTGLVDLKTLWKEVVFDARISLEVKDKKAEEDGGEREEGEEEGKGKKGGGEEKKLAR
jgi:predicted membrane chloride channel (bestrophin family)